MTKFDNLSIDEGTCVLSRVMRQVNDVDTLHETWLWDDIKGESLIFCVEDVSTLSEEALEAAPARAGLAVAGGQVTVSRSDPRFVFVNFNFSTDEG